MYKKLTLKIKAHGNQPNTRTTLPNIRNTQSNFPGFQAFLYPPDSHAPEQLPMIDASVDRIHMLCYSDAMLLKDSSTAYVFSAQLIGPAGSHSLFRNRRRKREASFLTCSHIDGKIRPLYRCRILAGRPVDSVRFVRYARLCFWAWSLCLG